LNLYGKMLTDMEEGDASILSYSSLSAPMKS